MINAKKMFAVMSLLTLALQMWIGRLPVFAETNAEVVINEVAWAGSGESSSDEWIELYNTTNENINLSGWKIVDDGETEYEIGTGQIAGKSFFVIEDNENAVENADLIVGLSLANSGDSLELQNSTGVVIDAVNSTGGEWPAGDSSPKVSMERIDPNLSGDDTSNWANASEDGTIAATPGGANNNFAGGKEVSLHKIEGEFLSGETLTFSLDVEEVEDLYAYGMEIFYDPSVFQFGEARESNFLKADGEETNFLAALENEEEGKLIIGNARLLSPAAGISGNGALFEMDFSVLQEKESEISLGTGSYLADSQGNLEAHFLGKKISTEIEKEDPGNNSDVPSGGFSEEALKIKEGSGRYSLELSWEDLQADSYKILRKNPDGSYLNLGEVESLSFVDAHDVLVNVNYEYQVAAIVNGAVSDSVNISGSESRGLSGDNDRSDRVDGKDLENLARSYGANFGENEYSVLADSNYDGIVDGSDLIDIGANFGRTY